MAETATHQRTAPNRLIASNPVDGMTVYARDGRKLGSLHSFILDKPTGGVAFAVLSFGGFLGLGQKYHPVPWALLAYDADRDSYIVNVDKAMLDGSPSYRPDDAPEFNDAYGERIATYYGRSGG
jgi:PRC-barrel domain protein